MSTHKNTVGNVQNTQCPPSTHLTRRLSKGHGGKTYSLHGLGATVLEQDSANCSDVVRPHIMCTECAVSELQNTQHMALVHAGDRSVILNA